MTCKVNMYVNCASPCESVAKRAKNKWKQKDPGFAPQPNQTFKNVGSCCCSAVKRDNINENIQRVWVCYQAWGNLRKKVISKQTIKKMVYVCS
jgi:hypothetical protein